MVNVGDLDYPGQPEEGLPSVCVCVLVSILLYIYMCVWWTLLQCQWVILLRFWTFCGVCGFV